MKGFSDSKGTALIADKEETSSNGLGYLQHIGTEDSFNEPKLCTEVLMLLVCANESQKGS